MVIWEMRALYPDRKKPTTATASMGSRTRRARRASKASIFFMASPTSLHAFIAHPGGECYFNPIGP